jgi:hypothetical protein
MIRPRQLHSGGLKVMLLAPRVKVVTRLRTSPLTSHDVKPNVLSKSGKLEQNMYTVLSNNYTTNYVGDIFYTGY